MVNECIQMYPTEQFSNNYTNPHYRKERSMTLSGSSSDSNNNFKSQSRRNKHQTPKNQNNPYEYQNYSSSRNIYSRHSDSSVMNVYADNLLEGMKKLREFSKRSTVVAIDTEFPGVIVKLHQDYASPLDLQYSNVKINNDLLKPIQIGFSFFDDQGNAPDEQSTIQFNFKFNSNTDMGNNESLDLLKRSGIDFDQLEKNGIDPELFAELFLITGLVMNENLTWVGFHCNHDWAYILKIITGWKEMPNTFSDFSELLQIYFPKTIDLKTLVIKTRVQHCGLQELSKMLKVERRGAQHQAGSDSRLTGESYFKFILHYMDCEIKPEWYNMIFGMNFGNNSNLYPPVQSPDDHYENSSESSRSSPYSGNATPDEETNSNNDESN
uniref:poly(A)-specific ribonuclease n=1 Tax=Dugesia japonica TaxID=6161 RepID=D5JG47_DUGJA|nr:CCR4-NOT transcription complex subunit 7 [Dugesia japonica]